jgi:hypothetical protein
MVDCSTSLLKVRSRRLLIAFPDSRAMNEWDIVGNCFNVIWFVISRLFESISVARSSKWTVRMVRIAWILMVDGWKQYIVIFHISVFHITLLFQTAEEIQWCHSEVIVVSPTGTCFHYPEISKTVLTVSIALKFASFEICSVSCLIRPIID